MLTVTGYFREGDYAICAPVVLLQLKAKCSVGGDNLLRGLTFIFLNPLIKVKDHNNVSENIGETF